MYNGWFCLGGMEIINNTRAIDYARTAECPVTWFREGRCLGINDRLEQEPYSFATIDQAPWWDSLAGTSESVGFYRPPREFLGVYCLSVQGLDDSTIEAPLTERVVSGGVIGRQRDAARRVRFRVILSATSERGLQYGRAWLENALRESICSTHNGSCGTTDLTFMTMCPPPYEDDGGGFGMYLAAMELETRRLHGVKCVSGPLVEQELKSKRGDAYGLIMEFTLAAESPRIYGMPIITSVPNSGVSAVQDTPYNLMVTPSAELTEGTVEIARNLATNPSVEVDATGWTGYSSIVSGTDPAGFRTSGRVNDIAASGTWSFRVRVLGNNGTTPVGGARSVLGAYQDVSIPAGDDRRVSLNIWGAAIIATGSSPGTVVNTVRAYYQFYNGGTPVGSRTVIDEAEVSEHDGHPYTLKSVAVPSSVTSVRVYAEADVTWSSSSAPGVNSDVRLYADALAVTIP